MFTLTGAVTYFSKALAVLLQPITRVSDDSVENAVYFTLLAMIALLLPLVSFTIYLSTVLFVLGWTQIGINSIRHLLDNKNHGVSLISSITFGVFFGLFLAKAVIVNVVSSNFLMYMLITGIVGVAGRLVYLGITSLAKFCFNIDITELLGTSIKNELIAMAKILGMSMADSYVFLLKIVLPPVFFIDLAVKTVLGRDRTFYQIITVQCSHIKHKLHDKYKVFIDFVSFTKQYGDPLEVLQPSQAATKAFSEDELSKHRQAFIISNSSEVVSFNRFNKLFESPADSLKGSVVKQLRGWSWAVASFVHEQHCAHEQAAHPQPAP